MRTFAVRTPRRNWFMRTLWSVRSGGGASAVGGSSAAQDAQRASSRTNRRGPEAIASRGITSRRLQTAAVGETFRARTKVEGLLTGRARALPLIELGIVLGLPEEEVTRSAQLVLHRADAGGRIGLSLIAQDL